MSKVWAILLLLCTFASGPCLAQFGPSKGQAQEAIDYDSCLGRNGHSWDSAEMRRAEIDRGWHCQAAREADLRYHSASARDYPIAPGQPCVFREDFSTLPPYGFVECINSVTKQAYWLVYYGLDGQVYVAPLHGPTRNASAIAGEKLLGTDFGHPFAVRVVKPLKSARDHKIGIEFWGSGWK